MIAECETCADLGEECITCIKKSRAKLLDAVRMLHKAVHDEGPKPSMHRRIMESHRHEWPALWSAIDKALKEYRGQQNAANRT